MVQCGHSHDFLQFTKVDEEFSHSLVHAECAQPSSWRRRLFLRSLPDYLKLCRARGVKWNKRVLAILVETLLSPEFVDDETTALALTVSIWPFLTKSCVSVCSEVVYATVRFVAQKSWPSFLSVRRNWSAKFVERMAYILSVIPVRF